MDPDLLVHVQLRFARSPLGKRTHATRRLRHHLSSIAGASLASGGTVDIGAAPAFSHREHGVRVADSKPTSENTLESRLSSGAVCCAVPRVRGLMPADFCAQYVDRGRPVVLAGAAADWPGMRTWSVEYLAQRVGNRTVDVALGVEEHSDPTVKASVGLLDLARQISASEAEGSSDDTSQPRDRDLTLFRGPVYLKQSNLFRLAPSLRDDVFVAELLGSRCTCSTTQYCWVGPRGATTGLHNDDEDNLLAQLRGRKRLLLYEPGERLNLYVNSKYDSGTECCDVDPSAPDYRLHPRLRNARPPLEVILSPGDVLFLPKFWYHHVTSLSATVSVNLFFSTPRDFVQHGLLRTGREILHAVGLLGRGNCVCHPAAATV